jgi:putative membrane protein
MPSSRFRQAVFLLAALASTVGSTDAFVAPQQQQQQCRTRVNTELYGNTKTPPPLPEVQAISYGEESRQYRRTVFTHEDWVKFRAPNRFIGNLGSIRSSGVYKNLGKEVVATTLVATFVCVWNNVFGGYTDFEGVKHGALIATQTPLLIGLPLTPFTLSSPSLGLLLGKLSAHFHVIILRNERILFILQDFANSLLLLFSAFRANQSYKRWDEARKNWGMNINHTRDLVRMTNAYYDRSAATPEQRKEDLQAVSDCTWAFVRSMKRHLSPEWEDEENFRKELYDRLPDKQAEAIVFAAHRPNRALFDLSVAIEALPMHFMRKNEVHDAVTIFEDNLGSSERLLTSPIPLFYTRHTARFLSMWLLLMPFALWDASAGSWNHVGMIPATAAISIFMFGIEEIATQLEEPFTILPMQAFCDKIGNWCNEIVSWEFGDNGMEINETR